MRIIFTLALALSSLNAFAALPEGHYSGRCDGASTMQRYEKGQPIGEAFAASFYQLLELTVAKEGDALVETLKTKLYGERGPDGDEFELKTKIEQVSSRLVKTSNIPAEGKAASLYRVDADGSEVWVQSIEKDGKVKKADGSSVKFVTGAGVQIYSALNNYETELKGKKFTGWALADSKIFCRTAPSAE
ncbi:MAG: hypothetical protein EOP11_09210 [Proteobacteria bacterium]|nr:MAG: hypothetical protein EOP11_09210 [Pseudomonadota bacterium]